MNIKINEVIKTDVVVIGGGAAGTRAAIEAYDNGVNVVLIVKGEFARTGSSFSPLRGWGMQAAFGDASSDDSPEEHLKEILDAGLGMCDVKLARILTKESPQRVADMEKYGIDFERKDGSFVRQVGCFSKKPRAIVALDIENIRSKFKNEIMKRDIKVLENTMAVDLLTSDKSCFGALCIKSNGNMICIKAKSTILATGGSSTIFKSNLNSPELTGDGQIMALNAGAELFNIEFIQFIYVAYPVKCPFVERVLEFYPGIYNAHNKLYLVDYLPEGLRYEKVLESRARHGPFSSRSLSKYFDIATYKEIMKGNQSEHGGIYIDLSMVSKEKIEKYSFVRDWFEWLLAQGIDDFHRLEISPCAHAFNGGIRINERAETIVEGLFAAGEVIGGPHGADRLGGNMISLTQVFGARAGRYAAIRAKRTSNISWDEEVLNRKCLSIKKLTEVKNGIKPVEVDEKIKKLMWNNVAICRTKNRLIYALEEFEKIEERDLPNIYI